MVDKREHFKKNSTEDIRKGMRRQAKEEEENMTIKKGDNFKNEK